MFRRKARENKFLWLFVVIVSMAITNLSVYGQDDRSAAELVKGREAYLRARTMHYNSAGTWEAINGQIEAAEAAFKKLPDGAEKFYWQGMACFLRAEIAEVHGDKREAAAKFTESGEWAEKALKCTDEISEVYRLLADTYLRLMNYNGILYAMGKASKAVKLLQKAVDLDAQNYLAYISLGTYYLYAPAISGGSVDKAITMFTKALASEDEFERFSANIWLGEAYGKKKEYETAERYLQAALVIYPNSQWAKHTLEKYRP